MCQYVRIHRGALGGGSVQEPAVLSEDASSAEENFLCDHERKAIMRHSCLT